VSWESKATNIHIECSGIAKVPCTVSPTVSSKPRPLLLCLHFQPATIMMSGIAIQLMSDLHLEADRGDGLGYETFSIPNNQKAQTLETSEKFMTINFSRSSGGKHWPFAGFSMSWEITNFGVVQLYVLTPVKSHSLSLTFGRTRQLRRCQVLFLSSVVNVLATLTLEISYS
jgi:hypothetical protein